MIPAEVIGRVVPNRTLECFRGVPFLLVQRIDEDAQPTQETIVAADAIGANVGEKVFIAQGMEATFPLPEAFNPSDMTIIAIIDSMDA